MVTSDESLDARFASATRVTVIILVPPDSGLLWPMFLVVNSAEFTPVHLMLNMKIMMIR